MNLFWIKVSLALEPIFTGNRKWPKIGGAVVRGGGLALFYKTERLHYEYELSAGETIISPSRKGFYRFFLLPPVRA